LPSFNSKKSNGKEKEENKVDAIFRTRGGETY
jgi:hypothetical protein